MKKLFFLLVSMTTIFAGYSEVQFHHGAGASYLVNFAKGAGAASAVEGVYHPRITFLNSDKLSLGVGVPLGIGFNFQASTFGGTGGALLVDVPGMVDLNFGHGSNHDNDSKLGGYVGAGFRYIFNVVFGGVSGIAHMYGPGTQAGIRFRTGNDLSFGVGANYAYDLNYRSHIIGVGFMFNIKE